MEYEIYIDSIFFSNFALNFLVLSLADKGFDISNNLKRRVFGSFIGSLVFCLFLILPILPIWFRMCGGSIIAGIVMSWCSFRMLTIEGIKKNLEEIMHYSLVLGGIMFCINKFCPFLNSFIGMSALAIGSYEVVRQVKTKWGEKKLEPVSAKLVDKGVTVSVKTLLDTGNGLVEPISGKPVCVVRKETAMRLWGDLDTRGFRAIPYHSVGCSAGILKGYPIEQILVEYEGKRITISDIYVAVTEGMLGCRQDYDMIMNPKILENMCL